jgi:hypothetical protein
MSAREPEYENLYRDSARDVRKYQNSEYQEFVNSITQDDFNAIEKWIRYFGTGGRPPKKNVELARRDVSTLPKHLQHFAQLRFTNCLEFRKIYQQIRYRWNDIDKFLEAKNWSDEYKLKKICKGIISRYKQGIKDVELEWVEDRTKLLEYLKLLYKKQNGLCALSNQEMNFEQYSENAVSADRIDSSLGYVKGNIQLTCWWANRMKFDLSNEDFIHKATIIANASKQNA